MIRCLGNILLKEKNTVVPWFANLIPIFNLGQKGLHLCGEDGCGDFSKYTILFFYSVYGLDFLFECLANVFMGQK